MSVNCKFDTSEAEPVTEMLTGEKNKIASENYRTGTLSFAKPKFP